MKKILNIIKFSVISFFALALFSCAQNVPEVVNSEGTLVFEYADYESFPQARLAVFTETSSDPRRTASVEVLCLENGFQWESDRIVIFESRDKGFAGVQNLYMPEDRPFSGGEYQVVYKTLTDETDSDRFYLSSHYDVYSMTVSEAEQYMKDRNGHRKLMIFDGEGRVLFYGEPSDFPEPMNSFPETEGYRYVWTCSGNLMCLLPCVKK